MKMVRTGSEGSRAKRSRAASCSAVHSAPASPVSTARDRKRGFYGKGAEGRSRYSWQEESFPPFTSAHGDIGHEARSLTAQDGEGKAADKLNDGFQASEESGQ